MTRHSRPGDPARDFCQWPYDRPSPPAIGALRQEAVLLDILAETVPGSALAARLAAIQTVVGRFGTVWGLKSDGRSLGVELYFYDYAREDRALSPARLAAAVPGLIAPGLTVDDAVPYFMWSLELDPTRDRPADTLDIYCNGFGGTVSGGVCYTVQQGGTELKNTYHFFESRADRAAIHEAMRSNPRFPGMAQLPEVLHPGAADEEIFVVAMKRVRDGVYFSRVRVGAALTLLDRCGIAGPIRAALARHQGVLGHHLFDVGLDYERAPDGTVQVTKAALYGIW
ncbi:MAG: hypothetical protein Q8K20_04425 [Gemmobacter sp.]|nr:hypothetical protein [Gemmobacter sp.]